MYTFAGGCLCGEVRYQATGSSHTCYSCHCRDCQYITGGSPNNAIFIPKAILTIHKGIPSSYTSKSDSGSCITRFFCGTCGTSLYGQSEIYQDSIVLKVGSLDDPSVFKSTMNVWVSSAQPWHYIDPDLPQYPKAPS